VRKEPRTHEAREIGTGDARYRGGGITSITEQWPSSSAKEKGAKGDTRASAIRKKQAGLTVLRGTQPEERSQKTKRKRRKILGVGLSALRKSRSNKSNGEKGVPEQPFPQRPKTAHPFAGFQNRQTEESRNLKSDNLAPNHGSGVVKGAGRKREGCFLLARW